MTILVKLEGLDTLGPTPHMTTVCRVASSCLFRLGPATVLHALPLPAPLLAAASLRLGQPAFAVLSKLTLPSETLTGAGEKTVRLYSSSENLQP